MKKRTTLHDRLIIPFSAVCASMLLNPIAQATCIVPDENIYTTSVKVVAVDAGSSCGNISGHEGIFINDNNIGTVKPAVPVDYQFENGNTLSVFAWFGPNGEIMWEADGDQSDPTVLGVDVAVVNGASGGANNCGYSYDLDSFAGIGGDQKNNGSFQNVTGVSFCSDGEQDKLPDPVVVQEPTVPLPLCGLTGERAFAETDEGVEYLANAGGALDQTAVNCPSCEDWDLSDTPRAGDLKALCTDGVTQGAELCTAVCGENGVQCDADGVPTDGSCVPPPITFVTHFEEKESNLGIDDGEWACFCNLQPSRNTVCRTDVPADDPLSCESTGGIPQSRFIDALIIGQENPPYFWRNGRCYGC